MRLLMLVVCALICSNFVLAKERLILFLPNKNTVHENAIQKNLIPGLKKVIQNTGINKLDVIRANQGLPKSISSLPAIVFQNYNGESVYQGRLYSFDRIENHIETSRYFSEQKNEDTFKYAIVGEFGKYKIVLPIKISDVTGTKPKKHKFDEFHKKAYGAILNGLNKFKKVDMVRLS